MRATILLKVDNILNVVEDRYRHSDSIKIEKILPT